VRAGVLAILRRVVDGVRSGDRVVEGSTDDAIMVSPVSRMDADPGVWGQP
jgi:hypothetical protein